LTKSPARLAMFSLGARPCAARQRYCYIVDRKKDLIIRGGLSAAATTCIPARWRRRCMSIPRNAVCRFHAVSSVISWLTMMRICRCRSAGNTSSRTVCDSAAGGRVFCRRGSVCRRRLKTDPVSNSPVVKGSIFGRR
jgi:hypothetical protein